MNTLEAILTRRSCREFTEQPIEGEKLHHLLEAAMSGPSCVNAQDWSFVVVTDPEKLAQMADANGRPAEPLRKAAAGILVCGDLDRAFRFAKDYWGSLTAPLPPRTSALLRRSWGLGQSGWALGRKWTGGKRRKSSSLCRRPSCPTPSSPSATRKRTLPPRVRAATRPTGCTLISGKSAGHNRPPPFLNGSGLFVERSSGGTGYRVSSEQRMDSGSFNMCLEN